MNNLKKENPWKGLASYEETEKLFGRDEEIESLYSNIIYNDQTVVYGRSGIGKSSILKAGIFPKARLDGILPVCIRFVHSTEKDKPSEPYIEQIHSAIEDELKKQGGLIKECVPRVSTDFESLWEYLHRQTFWIGNGEEQQRVKPLLIIDQFEEIFTLEKDYKRIFEFFRQLTDLLNGIKPDYLIEDLLTESVPESNETSTIPRSNNIFRGLRERKKRNRPEYLLNNDFHLVITLREDYLSHLERNTTNIPSLKHNRYCLEAINEEQAATIITSPLPELIDIDVAKLIIEKVTGEKDFELDGKPEIRVDLAILSLYLSRLFEKKQEGAVKITKELVNKFGDNVIHDFYLESIEGVSKSTIEYLEDHLLNNDGKRENVSVYNAIHIGGISEAELDYLSKDKKIIRCFSYDGFMRIEFIHDILCPIIDERRDKRRILKKQHEEEKRKIKAIEEKAKREREKMEWEADMARRKNRQQLTIAISLIFIILTLFGSWYILTISPYTINYGSITTKYGWPIGVGKKLNSDDLKNFTLYYKLTRKGWMPQLSLFNGQMKFGRPYERIDILNSKGQAITNLFLESPLVEINESDGNDIKAQQFAKLQSFINYWIFTSDNNGNLARKTAYSQANEELFAIQFFRSDNQNSAFSSIDDTDRFKEKFLWANYIDRNGKSMKVRDNGADRIRITVNKNGYYTGYAFFSESGTPQPNNYNVFGYSYKIDNNGQIIQKSSLDEFGDSFNKSVITYTKFDDFGRWLESTSGNAQYSRDLVVLSSMRGNDTLQFDEDGNCLYKSYYSDIKIWNTKKYHNNLLHLFKKFNVTKTNKNLLHMQRIETDKFGRIKEITLFDIDSIIPYKAVRYEYSKRSVSKSYFGGKDVNNITKPIFFADENGKFHKSKSDTTNQGEMQKVTITYIDTLNKLSETRKYNKDISFFENNYLCKRILYNKEGIFQSYLLDYKDGLLVSQSVMGIDGTPIRCPQWDMSEFCYYKMKFVRNFSNEIVAVKGVNEFGEESLITYKDEDSINKEYKLKIMPSSYFKKEGSNYHINGIQTHIAFIKEVPEKNNIQYIHITDKNGTYYLSNIRDGDIFLDKKDNTIKVARPDVKNNTYKILSFNVSEGEIGANQYTVYFTDDEMERLKLSHNK